MFALMRPSRERPVLLGWLAGLVYFSGTLYWITHVMAAYGGLSLWIAVPLNAGLIAYLAMFPAVFAAITGRLVRTRGAAGVLASPFVWVATELGRTHLLTGFPWVLLGYSQTTVLPVAQLASVVGVYGVSLLVASVTAAVALAFGPAVQGGDRFPQRHIMIRYVPLGVMIGILLLIATWGSRRVAASAWTRDGETVRVGLVQGNVDQAIKWDPDSAAGIFQDYLRFTRQAIFQGARLILWPESSTPFMFEEDAAGAAQLRKLVREAGVTLLFGSDQIERGTPLRFYNAAFALRPDGTNAGVYRKMHLVPFGEYVPFQRMLFFAAPLTEQVGTFSPGVRPELLPVDGHPVSVAICYEVVYPALVREFVAAGSELLTTITNDAWFGSTSAPYQHFEQASMRAIEEGRYLVRAANTGISGIVDPYGRVLARTEIFQPAVQVGEARFLRTSTFYTRHGDVVAYAAVAITIGLLIVPRRRERRVQ
jgi:apolipoprotein N-acyltransferase